MRTSRSLLSISVVLSVVATVGLVNPPATAATATTPPTGERCEHERNYPFIALSVVKPKKHAEVAVDEHGEITVEGIVNKRADLLDVSIDDVVTDDFETKGPPHGLGLFKSYSAKIRPPQLGENTLCVRAERLHKTAQQKRSFTAVDRIPPSDVPGLTVGGVTATSATVSWGAATDNYGLAGYDVVVDGGAPHRTAVGNRSYPISGLTPSTAHTVSVVAVDLAGNRSATPATASFTTTGGTGPPPNGDFTFVTDEGGATAQWSPDAVNDEAYRMYLDGLPYTDDIPLSELCTLCGPDTVLDFDIEPLDSNTSYTFKVEVIGDGGAVIRTLEGGFRTTDGPDYTSAGTDEFVGTEAKRCAGMGGDLFLAPVARSGVSVPPGSSQVFDGCWTVPDSSCFDALLPLSTARVLNCADDVTRLLRGLAPPGRGKLNANEID
ncbi:fibronectin type III domain-containing protein [Actinoplanes sp. NPDC051633]|uniref:fibronectin type III domain-containing protein n=1 Tax=Actinoplanes sp. NPDC051633 TaxID=3155670 RepID=UPI00344608F1